MTTLIASPHLAELDLQEAADSRGHLSAPQATHLLECLQCQHRVAAYQHLFTAAAHLPQPAFDFNLTASVLAQLPQSKPAFPWAVALAVTLVVGVVSVFLMLFGGALLPLVQGLTTGVGAGLGAVGGFVLAGLCLELLAQHRRQMSLLSLS